jgi:hypothetical protein
MARTECEVEFVDLETEDGREQEGVRITCSKCGHFTESYGTGGPSVRRCLVLMRQECPRGEKNFYDTDLKIEEE